MSLLDDPMIKRQIILEHYKKPKNMSLTNNSNYKKIHMDSESCVDDIHLELLVENKIIKDIRFDGEACTISTASTSIMSELLKNKSIEDAKKIIEAYNNMVFERPYDKELLEEALAFSTVSKQANRIKCALIGWDGIKELLEEVENE